MQNVEISEDRTSARLSIAKSLYSRESILRVCYWLERDLWFQLDEAPDRWIVDVSLRTKVPTLDQPRIEKIDEWIPTFFTNLLDSQLRIEIQAETSSIRELVLAKAFAESGVLEDIPPGTFQDPVHSPGDSRPNLINISTKVSDREHT